MNSAAGFISLSIFALFSLFAQLAGAATLAVPYYGLDNTHLEYNYTATGTYDILVKLVVTPPGSTEETLLASVAKPEPLVLQGKFHHEGLALGTYTYKILVVSQRDGDPPPAPETMQVASVAATLDGTSVQGVLLFDETINGQGADTTVINTNKLNVPVDYTLTINQAVVSGGDFQVYGKLELNQAGVTTCKMYSANTFESARNCNHWYFEEGSGGTSIRNGQNIDNIYARGSSLGLHNGQYGRVSAEGRYLVIRNSKVRELYGAGAKVLEIIVVDSKITDYTSFILESQTQVTCNRVRFEKSVNVNNAKGGKFIAEDCQFRLLADFTGGTLWIDKCVFVEKTNLWNRCSGHFFDNVFYRELSYNNNSSATNPQWGVPGTAPLIHGNSFLGKNAVTFSKWWGSNPPTPIPIGPNYYGDYYGPAWGYNSQWKFLEGRGASIVETANNVKIFDVSRNFIRTGPQRKDPDVFPEFWVAGYVIGQNVVCHENNFGKTTIEHVSLQGRETLLCLDLVATDEKVEGARVYVDWVGQTIYPMEADANGRVTLYRDCANACREKTWDPVAKKTVYVPNSQKARLTGRATLNFVLPPVQQWEVDMKIYIDTQNLSGYNVNQGEVKFIGGGYRYFQPEYAKPLTILVQPVRIYGPLYWSGFQTKAPGRVVARALENFIPSMYPVDSNQLNVIAGEPGWGYATTEGGVWNATAIGLASRRKLINSLYGTDITIICGVVQAGALSKFLGVVGVDIDGIKASYLDRAVIIDERKPTAALHEIGHACGLFLSKEQYNIMSPNGYPVEGATIIKNDENSDIHWWPKGLQNSRVLNIPAKAAPWYVNLDWFDMMGAIDYPIWILSDEQAAVFNALRGMLGQTTKKSGGSRADAAGEKVSAPAEEAESPEPQNEEAESTIAPGPPAAGTRRIFVAGILEKITENAAISYRLKLGSLRAMDISSLSQAAVDPALTGTGENYAAEAFDGGGASIFTRAFVIRKPYASVNPAQAGWSATFDIPAESARFVISRAADSSVALDLRAAASLQAQITQPAAGATLGDIVNVAWTSSAAKSADDRLEPLPAAQGGQPLQHLLTYSLDGGATWRAMPQFVEGQSAEWPTDSIPANNNISLRMLASDGLRTAEARVDGLRLLNHAPDVQIQFPAEGDSILAETTTTLRASAFDIEDGPLNGGQVTWASTLDGSLGTGATIPDVILSSGAHTITCLAIDSGGRSARAQIHITVGGGDTVDLRLDENAFSIQEAETDPNYERFFGLAAGHNYTCSLDFRNTGVFTTSTLSLFVQPPSGPEELLASETIGAAEFESRRLRAAFSPAFTGAHQFRGVVQAVSPEERDPSNNERIWTLEAAPVAYVFGDLNVDGVVDAADVVLLGLQASGALAADLQRGDLDGNGSVSMQDRDLLINLLVGNP